MGPNDSPGMNANPAEPSLLNDLGMESDASASGPSNPLLEESGLGQADGQSQGNLFKFAGREYRDQAHAEQSFKKMYGDYSETKGITNMVKKALQNPELLEALSEDPAWASIFAKLGIEADTQTVERQGQQQEDPSQEMHEWKVEREVDRLEREEYRFERELGRAMKPEERRTTLELIARHNTMTFKEAWQLANHERLLKEARAGQQAPRPKGNRPPPLPANTPGGSVNTKKAVNKMSESEWKENLRNDPDIKDLLSR